MRQRGACGDQQSWQRQHSVDQQRPEHRGGDAFAVLRGNDQQASAEGEFELADQRRQQGSDRGHHCGDARGRCTADTHRQAGDTGAAVGVFVLQVAQVAAGGDQQEHGQQDCGGPVRRQQQAPCERAAIGERQRDHCHQPDGGQQHELGEQVPLPPRVQQRHGAECRHHERRRPRQAQCERATGSGRRRADDPQLLRCGRAWWWPFPRTVEAVGSEDAADERQHPVARRCAAECALQHLHQRPAEHRRPATVQQAQGEVGHGFGFAIEVRWRVGARHASQVTRSAELR